MEGEQEVLVVVLEEVHQHDMEGKVGEMFNGVAAYISGLGVVERGEVVADVGKCASRHELQQQAFDGPGEIILLSYI